MTLEMTARSGIQVADAVATSLTQRASGPFYFTPDGLQAPLLERLTELVPTQNVVREDTAVAMAAGACLAGRTPVVLMQNSGLGQSVNALASLVLPYRLAMLLVVGMRGTDLDTTEENLVMGAVTEGLLTAMGIPAHRCGESDPEGDVTAALADVNAGRTAALLIKPGLFGWGAAK
ncbi:hypothetical protein [Micromonospora sp. NBC_01638]|uniref:hypothetical protein n=1 Tax=Micromonospora sp. NBC_01638 TaxID=2975982 RepID=UPI003864572D|nr:hypothetical protein OG811_23595 [Micromonospora sp. NBC_01638]